MDQNLKEYRDHLVKAEQQSLQDYDKTLLSLSGGALGISFAFVRDIIGDGVVVYSKLLMWAWGVWAASVAFTLLSYYVSHRALRKAIQQVDKQKIRDESVGGWFTTLIYILNAGSGILFVSGVVFIMLFVRLNLR